MSSIERPRISVVIPTFERAGLVARAIESALAQTRPPDEVIVVDDGSTDRTAEVVARFGRQIAVVRQPNLGVAAARNRGVARSTGAFVAFLDSDDYWEGDHLARIESAIEATDARAALYFSDLRLASGRDASASAWQAARFAVAGSFELSRDGWDWMLMPRQPVMIPATVVRRDAYVSVGGQAPNLRCREDTHFFLKMAVRGCLCAVAGLAGEATADDRARLTRTYASERGYWEATRWLYGDILRRCGGAGPEVRDEIRRRLAEAHFRLGRHEWRRRPVRSLRNLASAGRIDRRVVVERVVAWCA